MSRRPPCRSLPRRPRSDCRAELDAHVARYRINRDLLIATLDEAGLSRFAPAEGAFYLYVDVSDLTRDSLGFCRRMLDEIGVATTPGRDFDPIHGDDWLRMSFAGSVRGHCRSRAAAQGMAEAGGLSLIPSLGASEGARVSPG